MKTFHLYRKLIIVFFVIIVAISLLVVFSRPQSKKTQTNNYKSSSLGVIVSYPSDWQLTDKPSEGISLNEAIVNGKAKLSFTPNPNENKDKIDLTIIPTDLDLDAVTKQYAQYAEKERKFSHGIVWSIGEIPAGSGKPILSCLAFGITTNRSFEFKEFKNQVISINCQNFNLESKKLRDFIQGIDINDK